jgi:N-acetyl-gamma-glutamyl-phosphate reductase
MQSPRHYALGRAHKHVPEMRKVTGLTAPFVFMPIVGNYYSGMVVTIPFHTRLLSKPVGPSEIRAALAAHYAGERFVRVAPENAEGALDRGYFPATTSNGTNNIELFTFGDTDVVAVMARFDNLGKGASGAAIQCMNVMLDVDEGLGVGLVSPGVAGVAE